MPPCLCTSDLQHPPPDALTPHPCPPHRFLLPSSCSVLPAGQFPQVPLPGQWVPSTWVMGGCLPLSSLCLYPLGGAPERFHLQPPRPGDKSFLSRLPFYLAEVSRRRTFPTSLRGTPGLFAPPDQRNGALSTPWRCRLSLLTLVTLPFLSVAPHPQAKQGWWSQPTWPQQR